MNGLPLSEIAKYDTRNPPREVTINIGTSGIREYRLGLDRQIRVFSVDEDVLPSTSD
jgi:hypothetical protein